MRERWKAVVGFEGLYEVSNLGRVRSLVRGGMLTPCRSRGDYLCVNMHLDGKQYFRKIHRIVLDAFVGVRPEGHEARHWDGNRQNNKLRNLRWGTPKENGADVARHGSKKGTKHHGAKLTEADVLAIRSSNDRVDDIAAKFGISRSHTFDIRSGKYWGHV